MEYECEDCGYELSALAVEAHPVRCPECGREYAWPPPLRRRARPGWWRLAVPMCGPTVGVVAVLVVATRFDHGVIAIAFGWPLLLFAWLFAAIGAPALVAGEIAARCVLRPGRWRARWAIQLAGVGINVGLTVAAFSLIAAL